MKHKLFLLSLLLLIPASIKCDLKSDYSNLITALQNLKKYVSPIESCISYIPIPFMISDLESFGTNYSAMKGIVSNIQVQLNTAKEEIAEKGDGDYNAACCVRGDRNPACLANCKSTCIALDASINAANYFSASLQASEKPAEVREPKIKPKAIKHVSKPEKKPIIIEQKPKKLVVRRIVEKEESREREHNKK